MVTQQNQVWCEKRPSVLSMVFLHVLALKTHPGTSQAYDLAGSINIAGSIHIANEVSIVMG